MYVGALDNGMSASDQGVSKILHYRRDSMSDAIALHVQ